MTAWITASISSPIIGDVTLNVEKRNVSSARGTKKNSTSVTTVSTAAASGAPRTRSIETLIAAPPGIPPIAAAAIVKIRQYAARAKSTMLMMPGSS